MRYRCSVTPTCRQYSSTGQVEHFGRGVALPLDLRGNAARRLKKHELFEVLKSAHHQAWWAVNAPPDTS